jgi:hypothetical protein
MPGFPNLDDRNTLRTHKSWGKLSANDSGRPTAVIALGQIYFASFRLKAV